MNLQFNSQIDHSSLQWWRSYPHLNCNGFRYWSSIQRYPLHACTCSVQFSCSVMSNSFRPHELHAARQASLSITNSWSLPKPMFIQSVMPSNHLILCRPLLLPPITPSIRVFSNESALRIRWPKYWSWTVAFQAPLSMGFSQQKYWSRLSFPPPGDIPDPGIEPASPVALALQKATHLGLPTYLGGP